MDFFKIFFLVHIKFFFSLSFIMHELEFIFGNLQHQHFNPTSVSIWDIFGVCVKDDAQKYVYVGL